MFFWLMDLLRDANDFTSCVETAHIPVPQASVSTVSVSEESES